MKTDPIRLALVIAGLLLLYPGAPSSAHLAFLIGVAGVLALATWRSSRRGTILLLVLGAIVVRVAIMDRVGSDVLRVTEAAVRRMLAATNPYGFGYPESSPPGAPFPYGPVAILWYAPAGSRAELFEVGAAIAIACFLAVRGRLLGLAVYATAQVLINSSIDGSNDTTLGLLILAAFVAAERWQLVGAGILGVAVGFKLSALAFVPLYVAWAGWRAAGVVVSASIIAWSPVIGNWGVTSFLRSVQMAEDAHSVPTWALGRIVKDITGAKLELLDQLRYVLGGFLAFGTLALRPRTLDTIILGGTAVYLVTLYAGNWASYAYLAGIAPVICWRLDGWLGAAPRSADPDPAADAAPASG